RDRGPSRPGARRMTTAPTFTILLPIHRPPDLLHFAVGSVLRQTRPDFELFVICDGAPAATAEAARAYEAQDPRIRARVHPKGERNGEAWRHLALQEARGRVVCQIGDDDLWFPEHLAEAEALMAEADFGNTLPLYMEPDGSARLQFNDFADPTVRRQMAEGLGNAFGPTPSAYRMETYRALPVGWSPAPPESRWSDLFMWRKFLALPGIRCATRFVASSMTFPQALRQDWTMEGRREEIATWSQRIQDPAVRDRLWRSGLADAAHRLTAARVQISAARSVAKTLLTSVDVAEEALTRIAGGGDSETHIRLAREALAKLPDRARRDGIRPPTAQKS
ncbi:MAG TPA: glycosyltransferase family A protein, partial [Caulobacteraceae bacterium]|nr:glycosyltransferase family A protein [Caulobacteraceae bacterium]